MKVIIHHLRIWDSQSSRIKSKYFVKKEILFGSDAKADVRMDSLSGFYARLDFETGELYFLETQQSETLKSGDIFQMGTSAVQWKIFKPLPRSFYGMGFIILFGSSLLLWSYTRGKKAEPPCSNRSIKIASGSWGVSGVSPEDRRFFEDLRDLRKSFLKGLKSMEWVKARADLNSIREFFNREDQDPRCGVLQSLTALEGRFSEALILKNLREKDPLKAAQVWKKFKDEFQTEDLEYLKKRMIREALKTYYQGYRLEDESAEHGQDLMDQAQKVCLYLNLPENCFKPKMKDSLYEAGNSGSNSEREDEKREP